VCRCEGLGQSKGLGGSLPSGRVKVLSPLVILEAKSRRLALLWAVERQVLSEVTDHHTTLRRWVSVLRGVDLTLAQLCLRAWETETLWWYGFKGLFATKTPALELVDEPHTATSRGYGSGGFDGSWGPMGIAGTMVGQACNNHNLPRNK